MYEFDTSKAPTAGVQIYDTPKAVVPEPRQRKPSVPKPAAITSKFVHCLAYSELCIELFVRLAFLSHCSYFTFYDVALLY